MSKKSPSANLKSARKNKNDEFYTQLSDIENELKHYTDHFKDKVVYCNCDDPRDSNFFHYFAYNFEKLGLKKLITACYNSDSKSAVHLEYNGDKNGNRVPDAEEIGINHFVGNGDFRSDESIELLKQADIVVTNPPFSLFREYIAQLMEHDKKFLIIGNLNAVTYKEVFPLIKDEKIWYGKSVDGCEFKVPKKYKLNAVSSRTDSDGNNFKELKIRTYQVDARARWFTNLDHTKRHEDLILYKTYNQDDYPKYDNYNAINVDKVAGIPMDYDGVMGVPITFLDRFNPDQFKIVSSNDYRANSTVPFKEHGLIKDKDGTIDGKAKYVRILIKNKRKIAS